MSFLSPWFLLGGLTVALPMVLHLLRRAPDLRVKFAAVHMLKVAPAEREERRRLRELLLLALRVGALLLLTVAFARPFLAAADSGVAGVIIVALDTSLSMGPADRFERARTLARNAIAKAPASYRLGVVTFADTAVVAVAPTSDRRLATAAVNAAAPGFGGTRYRGAINAAAGMLADHGAHDGRIVVVTDLQAGGWAASDQAIVSENTRVEVVDVGAGPANLAVSSLVRNGDRLVAGIRGSDEQPQPARVHLIVDGRPAGDASVVVGAGRVSDVSLPVPLGGTAAEVRVEDARGIQGDNARYLVLDRSSRPTVLIVGSGAPDRDAFYLRRALLAARDGEAFDVEALAATGTATWDAKKFAAVSAAVVVSTRNLDHHGRELLTAYVRGGGGAIISAGPDVDGALVNEMLGGVAKIGTPPDLTVDRTIASRHIVPIDGRHPLFAAFGSQVGALSLVNVSRFAALETSSCQLLARFTSGEAALVDCALGSGRVLVFASDLDKRWNDFPLAATFVPFLHESIRYVAGKRPRAQEYLVGSLQAGVPDAPGVVRRGQGADAPLIAVNVDPRETGAGRLSEDQFMAPISRSPAAQAVVSGEELRREDGQRLWRYALGLMLVAMLAESMVAARAS